MQGGQSSTGDLLRVQDQYYVLATSALADQRTRVLKHGETFAVLDRHGDVHPIGRGEQGLYHRDTRYLNRLELRLEGERPLLLSSTITPDNAIFVVDLTNARLRLPGGDPLPQDTIHLLRSTTLSAHAMTQQVRIRSFAELPLRLELRIRFAADFADLFEVRGVVRKQCGRRRAPRIHRDRVELGYAGLDGVERTTRIGFDPVPIGLDGEQAWLVLELPPGGEQALELTVDCLTPGAAPAPTAYAAVAQAAADDFARRPGPILVTTTHTALGRLLDRSAADLRMMLTDTPHGSYPHAGVPWFDAPFGRDGLITALQTLWCAPEIARGVLRFLAATQATERDPDADAEPGKILHEMRGGEMAALREVPFRRYYGSIDATPLFVLLAHATWVRTGDDGLIDELWPPLLRALEWMRRDGDRDGDGFLEYQRCTPDGLVNQGWKDSHDAVAHADGGAVTGAIALCEVQAYAYGAWRGAAALAAMRGDAALAASLGGTAERLQQRFEQAFWSDEIGCYALALDGGKRRCAVRSSNAGQCLLTGIAAPERARAVADTLLDERSFTGWGIRTLAAGERRYNPISYHNGSVWPHDNALIAAGLARYGFKRPVATLLDAFCDAAAYLELQRMPELFCGMQRRPDQGPTLYPVACSPQAWAAGSVFLLLQSCLGLEIDARARRILFRRPVLPGSVDELRLHDLRVGDASIDLAIERHPHDVALRLLRRDGEVELVVVK